MTEQTAQPDAPVLSLRDVVFGYNPGSPVVSGVSAELWPGRITALIGPNAAGKSTLLKMMLGQLLPEGGTAAMGGREVGAIPPGERARRLSYVPQRGGVSFAYSVREVVEMGRFAVGQLDAGVGAAMRACEVADLGPRVFSELSGGQQQRVLVARAMAQLAQGGDGTPRPGTAMLLDEPGSNMDLRHQHALMAMLRRQADAGVAVLIVLHDVNLAAKYADDVWLMDAGRLVATGAWREVLTPGRLEPVYGMALRVVEAGDRPVFIAEPGVTLSGAGD